MADPNRLLAAINRIDAANAQDPRTTSIDGRDVPDELLYSQRMTEWLDRLEPAASEALRLATRAEHLRRWEIPRDSYPMTREGYRAWREFLYDFHAQKVGEILRDLAFDEPAISRVQSLVRKERIKADPESQTLEDVACLVFLEFYFVPFIAEHAGDEEKIIGILRRTWKKMSDRGRTAAGGIALPEEAKRLVAKALSP